MPPFDRPTLLAEARRRGNQAGFFEKSVRLLHLLDLIGHDSALAGTLSLRGGTAINLFYLPGPRLSVDADLSYIGSESAEDMRRARPVLESRIRQIAEAEGYEVRSVRSSYALGGLELRYQTVHSASDFIKLDINYIMRIPLAPTRRAQAVELLPGVGCTFTLTGKEEVYAGKLKALVQRIAERDVFDVDRLIRAGELTDLPDIRYFATFLLATDTSDARLVRPEQLVWPTAVDYMNAIYPMVREADRRPLPDVRESVEPVILDFLTWDERQRAFLEAVAARRPAGAHLFPSDAGLAAKIDRHPAMLWRYTNPEAGSIEA